MIKRSAVGMAVTALLLAGCQSNPNPEVQARNSEFGCIAGTVGGAIVGGLIGSTIGGGGGRVLAEAAGIGGGGFLGNRLACR